MNMNGCPEFDNNVFTFMFCLVFVKKFRIYLIFTSDMNAFNPSNHLRIKYN